jgi:hypothetical protein
MPSVGIHALRGSLCPGLIRSGLAWSCHPAPRRSAAWPNGRPVVKESANGVASFRRDPAAARRGVGKGPGLVTASAPGPTCRLRFSDVRIRRVGDLFGLLIGPIVWQVRQGCSVQFDGVPG